MLEESRYFFEYGKYRCSTFQEVSTYMLYKGAYYMRTYQIGLLVSLFLWPNHIEMRKHFIGLLSSEALNKKGNYLEVGVGHGYYFSSSIKHTSFDSYLGVDINEDSVHMANAVI